MYSKRRATGRFSHAQDEQLIEMVTSHPILWNMEHTEFKNVPKKDLIWKEIGKSVNKTEVQCKVRWKSIRDHYKRHRVPVEGVKKRAPYWNKLTFLDTLQTDRRSFLSTRIKYESQLERDIVDVCSDPLDLGSTGDDVSLASTSGDMTKKSEGRILSHNRTERKEERLKYRRMMDKMVESDDENDIDLFFKTMAATVKKFDCQTKAEVKMKIFNVVTEMEMKNIKARKTSGRNFGKS